MRKAGWKGLRGREEGRKKRQGREGVVKNEEEEEWDMKKGRLLHDLNSS